MAWLSRTLAFAGFALQEYLRSGRVVVELAALAAAVWLLFYPRDLAGISAQQFFTLAGLVIFGLTAYTTLVLTNLGNRPQGYVLISRPLGRTGYLLGLYVAILALATFLYLLLSGAVVVLHALRGSQLALAPEQWFAGSLPLMLDAALIAALVMLLSALVLSSAPRLILLAVLVFALSSDILAQSDSPLATVAQPLQSVLSLPLLPVLSGFALAVQQTYTPAALGIIAGQVAVTALLLVAALYAFSRRDLILPS